MCFDVNNVCTGWVTAVMVASSLLRDQSWKNALVIGVDIFSRLLDWENDRSCILFGDGAGAAVITNDAAQECGETC